MTKRFNSSKAAPAIKPHTTTWGERLMGYVVVDGDSKKWFPSEKAAKAYLVRLITGAVALPNLG